MYILIGLLDPKEGENELEIWRDNSDDPNSMSLKSDQNVIHLDSWIAIPFWFR